MKILVAFMGGTIGSSIKDGVADVDGDTASQLINMYGKDDSIDFEGISPLNILSENSTADALSDICNFMLSVDYNKYDGVIVTHGSDTLAYTSALLGLALSWVKIPVVITAADYVLSLPYSNGLENFRASVDFIKGFCNGEHKNTGVFTVWKNHGKDIGVYISTRLNEADGYNDFFSSWGDMPFGTMKNGKFKRIDCEINPPYTISCEKTAFLKNSKLNFKNNILLLKSYPGFDFNAINLHGKRAVVLQLYHSATACAEGENTSAYKFIEKCTAKNIDIYLFSAKMSKYSYKSSHKMLDKNVNSLYNVNVCSAYAKALLACAVDEAYKKDFTDTNIFYESLPDKTISEG